MGRRNRDARHVTEAHLVACIRYLDLLWLWIFRLKG